MSAEVIGKRLTHLTTRLDQGFSLSYNKRLEAISAGNIWGAIKQDLGLSFNNLAHSILKAMNPTEDRIDRLQSLINAATYTIAIPGYPITTFISGIEAARRKEIL